MRTYTKILPLAIALTACGGGGGSTNPVETPVSTTPPTTTSPPPPTVTSTEEYCDGFTLYRDTKYSDDTVNTELLEENSEECGYVPIPVEGTPIGDSYCARTLAQEEYTAAYESINHLLWEDRLQKFADGEGGVYVDRTVHIDQTCFVQMEKPTDCPSDASDTGDSRYGYFACDGIKQLTGVDFPFDPENINRAVIDMLFVVDTNLTEEDRDGMTVEQFVDKQVFEANHIFMRNGTYTLIRVAGIKMVDVAPGDLYRQYAAFLPGRQEFLGLDDWQREAGADLAFLFKKLPENGIACGVASIDATRGIDKTRGIIQCFANTDFKNTSTTRYYERANETFAHEIGHLLGAQHEESDTTETGLFEYSFGYNIPGYNPQEDNPEYAGIWGGYGTIMSYADLATGSFSNFNKRGCFPDTAGAYAGQSVTLGTTGGCFCSDPIETQESPTNNAETIQRTRYTMSQLHEQEHTLQFSPIPAAQAAQRKNKLSIEWELSKREQEKDPHICLF